MFLQRSEATKAFHLVRESTRNNVSTVLWATGTLNGQPKTVRIPVDSVTQRITFTFSVDTKGNARPATSNFSVVHFSVSSAASQNLH